MTTRRSLGRTKTMDVKKTILVDCDGVLLEWLAPFQSYIEKQGYVKKIEGEYSISKSYGVPYNEMKRHVCNFNKSEKISCLEPMRDAVEFVNKLHNEGYKFHVISSQTDDKIGRIYRRYNLLKVFGDVFHNIDEIELLSCGADKDEALSKYKDSGMYWIEDKPINAQVGNALGLRSLLMKHDHNEDYLNEDIPLVNDWSEIYEIITGND